MSHTFNMINYQILIEIQRNVSTLGNYVHTMESTNKPFIVELSKIFSKIKYNQEWN